MDMRAATAFHKVVKGSNFMTPNARDYGFIGNSCIAYEISEGEGIYGEIIYGFTVGLPTSDPRRGEWSGLFYSLADVTEHIDELDDIIHGRA